MTPALVQDWQRVARIVDPPAGSSWARSHAALPFLLEHPTGPRVYFSPRDERGRASIAYAQFDAGFPSGAPSLSTAPALRHGPLGAFDDSGVTLSWIVRQGELLHLYYTGWSLGVTVPFYLGIGVAISRDGGNTFTRVSPSPALGRSLVDPFLTASPCVLVDGGTWRMWYVSGVRWVIQSGRPMHYYNIKYAESADGIEWNPTGHPCIDFVRDEEYAIGRPSVVKDGDLYRMWYCFRGSSYQIGYAESHDGIAWERQDDLFRLTPEPEGWDKRMQAYPYVFDYQNSRYMLYNGNGYGQSGIGLALLTTPGIGEVRS